jgi:hypothetical protein
VSYYPLNNNGNDVANQHNLDYNSAVSYTTGKFSECGVFTGSTPSMLACSVQVPALNILGNVTITAWIKTSAAGVIFENTTGAGNNKTPWDFALASTTTLGFMRADDSSKVSVTSDAFTNISGAWHFVAVTHNTTTNLVKFYLDGSQTGVDKTMVKTPTSGGVNLPVMGFDGFYAAYTGNLEEVGVWSRELSSAEISQLYNNGFGLRYPFTLTGPFPVFIQ